MPSEIKQRADFSLIRYAQCWEDADVLLAALEIQPHHTCLAIASAGDNTLAMVAQAPQRIIAVDLSPAQIACLALRVAAYRELSHPELLLLIGSISQVEPESYPIFAPPQASETTACLRIALYQRCRSHLSASVRQFWDERPQLIAQGIGTGGKFERYLGLFRRTVLPLIHGRDRVLQLLQGGTPEERKAFYHTQWDSWRWRSLFRGFFSQFVLGRLGRDPSFFQYVKANVAEHLLERTYQAMTALDPAENPYLQWIATGHHLKALPYALRPENFAAIRANLDRLEWHCIALEDFLETQAARTIDRYNLSNVFEYMSPSNYHRVLKQLVRVGQPGGRLVYWNLLAERHRPETMAEVLHPLSHLAERLYQQDRAFFYSDLIVEEIH